MPVGRVGGIGIGTVVVVMVVSYFLGVDPSALLGVATEVTSGGPAPTAPAPAPPASDEKVQCVAKVLRSTERTWGEIFRADGKEYVQPRLFLFSAPPTR